MSGFSQSAIVFRDAYLARQSILNYTSLTIPSNNNPTASTQGTKVITVPNFSYYYDFFSVELPQEIADGSGNRFSLSANDITQIRTWQVGVIDALLSSWLNFAVAPYNTTIIASLNTARTRVQTAANPTFFITLASYAHIATYIPMRDAADYAPVQHIPTATDPTPLNQSTRELVIHNFVWEYDFFSFTFPSPLIYNNVPYTLTPADRLQVRDWQLGILNVWITMWNFRTGYAPVRTALANARTRVLAIV